MSGIYGILAKSSAAESRGTCLNKISIWNMAYGDDAHDSSLYHNEVAVGKCEMGIYRDHITSAPLGTDALVTSGAFTAAIDAIVYNRTELLEKLSAKASLSDEELILKLIIKFGFDILSEIKPNQKEQIKISA
ncbi:MAG: hypothetical protein MJ124_09605, partial [Lachnospiraceae bacterium]|nr:hypothetical protein [Lachnospiraceae bacterium]